MDALEQWSDFNVALAGATAALAGLIIVAMSVNIAEIMKAATLASRAAAAISTLVLALIASLVGLMPGTALWALGVVLLIGTLIAATFQARATHWILKDRLAPRGAAPAKIALGFIPLATYAVGSVALLCGLGWGLTVVAAASIVAILGAVMLAWVVLVEILR
ncbi:hypothetical protein [Leifsonia sp. Leaf264]|uniref:hypothetical protein n=1 Tax=Leifsonia sp. Leaf264 TaxID=1736314 RepID=UPI0006F5922C|nr:hypothetical protein [Leifsonia sp. Leaf264]KQO95436.1 hypothetical protein ASF30_20700 [Leifsonia sp. Leaf264]